MRMHADIYIYIYVHVIHVCKYVNTGIPNNTFCIHTYTCMRANFLYMDTHINAYILNAYVFFFIQQKCRRPNLVDQVISQLEAMMAARCPHQR